MVDDHHLVISSDFSSSFAGYLRSHPPDTTALQALAADNNPDADEEDIGTLRETHDFLEC